MTPEVHQSFQRLIDELLVEGGRTEADPRLAEHLRTCAACEHYLQANRRVIEALGDFDFHVEAPQKTALPSLSARAMGTPGSVNRNQLTLVCCVACSLFLFGSWIDLGAGRLLEALFQSRHLHVRTGIIGFWIMPSFFILFLFPMLPLLTRREEGIA